LERCHRTSAGWRLRRHSAQFALGAPADDVARLRQVLARQNGPTIVPGHFYGGQIMTALGTDAPNVIGLIHVAAFGLDEGDSTLTASIAHEVSQPLSGIVTNASTCLRMLAADPPDVDGARETARRTIRDGNRASDVIARVRALFTNKESATESVDLTEATREVIALSLTELQQNRASLQSELAHDLPAVTGDRVQLQQVILNLLRNACEAMVDVHDRPRQLLIKTEREDGDRVRVSVRDAGVGVDPQNMDKLLDAFYTTKTDGMGIGLSVSRSIIESHHGRLWAEPNDGPGATFSFSIPGDPESVYGRDTAMRRS
jgi:signal transduction histidine kinase